MTIGHLGAKFLVIAKLVCLWGGWWAWGCVQGPGKESLVGVSFGAEKGVEHERITAF